VGTCSKSMGARDVPAGQTARLRARRLGRARRVEDALAR
jgi:hypothetical protein